MPTDNPWDIMDSSLCDKDLMLVVKGYEWNNWPRQGRVILDLTWQEAERLGQSLLLRAQAAAETERFCEEADKYVEKNGK